MNEAGRLAGAVGRGQGHGKQGLLGMKTLDPAALLSSRLRHHLVGPIGALDNGLEIPLDETDAEPRRRAIGLMVDSAGLAARRLKF